MSRALIILMVGAGLAGQTRISDRQLGRLAEGTGVVVQTDHGPRTATPLPGFSYMVQGSSQVQFLSTGERRWIYSDVPVRQTDGRWVLRWRPDPAVLAVYMDGLRLSPEQYRLIWLDPDQLPDRVEIPGSTSSSRIVCDYQTGADPTVR